MTNINMQRCQNDECDYIVLPMHKSCPKCGTPLPTDFGKLIGKLLKTHSESDREKLLEDAGIDMPGKTFAFLKILENHY